MESFDQMLHSGWRLQDFLKENFFLIKIEACLLNKFQIIFIQAWPKLENQKYKTLNNKTPKTKVKDKPPRVIISKDNPLLKI